MSALLLWLLLVTVNAAWAHAPSHAYLFVETGPDAPQLTLDVALRDLETAVGLDGDGDGRITWGELKARRAEIERYALERLTLAQAGVACASRVLDHRLARYAGETYVSLPLEVGCAGAATLHYRLLFEQDPTHRGVVMDRASNLRLHLFAAESAEFTLELPFAAAESTPRGSLWATFIDYLGEGIWHIWIGADHLLFVLTLLLPAVLVRDPQGWRPSPRWAAAVGTAVRLVTAFTIAHSITLGLAATGLASPPSRWIEIGIALSVALAAVNNLRPFLPGPPWAFAFAFGLLHGFGFAGVLLDLGLATNALFASLAGFNLGVELGQLAIVLAVFPLMLAARGRGFYQPWVLRGGSAAIGALAVTWVAQRALG